MLKYFQGENTGAAFLSVIINTEENSVGEQQQQNGQKNICKENQGQREDGVVPTWPTEDVQGSSGLITNLPGGTGENTSEKRDKSTKTLTKKVPLLTMFKKNYQKLKKMFRLKYLYFSGFLK